MSASLERRLQKLEATHKRVLRCAWCRYALREVPPSEQQRYRAQPASVLVTKCWHCGARYVIQLERTDEHYREAADLVHNSHPVKRLTIERIHAAELWLSLSASEKDKYLKDRQEKAEREASPRPSSRRAYQPTIRPNAKERKAQAERQDLEARARAFVQKKQEEFKRRAGRTEPFPIDENLKALEDGRCHSYDKPLEAEAEALGLEKYKAGYHEYTAHIATIRNSIINLRKRAACEVVVWGAALPDTLEEIAFFEALPPVAVAEALEKQREEKEKAERETAEREAARLARLAPVPVNIPAPSAANSDFWRSEDEPSSDSASDDDFLRGMMGEATYNSWMEVRKLYPPTTDEQGRKRSEPRSTPPPNDGRDPYYNQRMAYYKVHGVWPTNEMLSR